MEVQNEIVIEAAPETVPVPVPVPVTAPATVPVTAPATAPVTVPATVPATMSIPMTMTAPVHAISTIKPSFDKVDTLYNKIILNSSLLSTIHDLQIKGFDNASIPMLILSITSAYDSYIYAKPSHAITVDDLQVLLERVYNYLVDKYNLIDVKDRLAMYNLFDLSLKLCLATPNIKKNVTSCLNLFKCSK